MPPLLREGANRAYHEAVGSLDGPRRDAAALRRDRRPFDRRHASPIRCRLLLKEALNYVVFIPWSTGTMFHFEKELYADDLAAREVERALVGARGAATRASRRPTSRGERFCDAATKTHINDDPAGYYDYALSFVLLFQLHDHIASRSCTRTRATRTTSAARKWASSCARSSSPAASVDWNALLREKTGADLTAQPMLRYFEPLMGWLKQQNEGRKATLPDL